VPQEQFCPNEELPPASNGLVRQASAPSWRLVAAPLIRSVPRRERGSREWRRCDTMWLTLHPSHRCWQKEVEHDCDRPARASEWRGQHLRMQPEVLLYPAVAKKSRHSTEYHWMIRSPVNGYAALGWRLAGISVAAIGCLQLMGMSTIAYVTFVVNVLRSAWLKRHENAMPG